MSLSALRAAAEAPTQVALIDDQGALTYAALGATVRGVMKDLRERGVRGEPGQRVALVARPARADLLALFALLELGVAPLLIHPRLTTAERAAVYSQTRVDLALDLEAEPLRGAPMDGAAPLPADDGRPGAVVFTSGSTGRPKGVVLSRAALVASAAASAANLGWEDEDRWLLCMPLAHVGGLALVLRCLLARRTIVIAPPGRFDPQALDMLLRRERVTLLSLVPTMLQRLLALPGWAPPASLRALLLGGAPAPGTVVEAAVDRGVPLLTTYGLTEAGSQVTTQRYGRAAYPGQGAGPPLPGVAIDIREGRVALRGRVLLSGYLDDPRPALGADGSFLTSDLGRLDEEGRLHLLGRVDDLIITGGENVFPIEVEDTLLRCPGVAAACVFGVADPLFGQVVAAALVGEVSFTALRTFCQTLAPHRRPRRVALLPELALLPNGKVDRAATATAAAPHLRPL